MARHWVWSIPKVAAILAVFLSLALLTNAVLAAATHIDLGDAEKYAILAGSGITNTGATTITGDAGSAPTSTQTGFASVTFISGTNHPTADADTLNAKIALTTAYINAAGQDGGPSIPITANLGTMSPLLPGVYNSGSSIALTGNLTLDGGGDPNAIFVFQAGSTLTTASSSEIVLTNGAQACNVYWQVGSSATLGTSSTFVGNIFAYASITDDGGSTIDGRFLAETGAVTLNNTTISRSLCAPEVSKSFSPDSITTSGISTLTLTFTNFGNTADAILTSSFTDNLASGIEIASTPNLSTTCGGSGSLSAVAGGSEVSMPAGRSIPGGGSCTITVDVAAPAVGVYINTIPSGALVTSNGSNTNAANATLTSTSITNVDTSIVTTLSDTSITVGGSVYDSASMSVLGASGTVTYFVYTDNACTLNGQNAGIKTLIGSVVPDSNPITFNSAGTYYWQAAYSGDSSFNPSISACTSEVLTVNKVTPTITSSLSSTSITTGSSVYANSTLVGATGGAMGTATYTIFTDSALTLNPQDAGIMAVSSGIIQASDSVTFNTAGTFYWQVVYTGDNNNNGVSTSVMLTVTRGAAARASGDATAAELLKSGFAPQHKTILPIQPVDKSYSDLADLWLEIPNLNVNIPIVGVPRQASGGWDVSWLGNQAGWLNGTAFPTLSGNSVLTGHVVDANGDPGPFVGLLGLSWGDNVIIHAWGSQYIYKVQQVTQVDSDAVSSGLKHEDSPYITLITCRGYDEASDSYKYRVIVRAVFSEVK